MSNPQPQNQTQTVNTVTAALIGLFAAAQLVLIGKFAALIARYGGGDLLLNQMRKASQATAAGLQQETPALVTDLVAAAVEAGTRAGDSNFPGGPPSTPGFGLAGDTFESHAERSARAIREDLDGKLNGLGYRITRFADDAYRAVVADAAMNQVLGRLTPAQAQHDAYTKLLARGIDGFTDSTGRNWELSAYVDVAVRSTAQRAYNVSNLDRMQARGINYFVVSDDGNPCPLCLPWQGVVLTAGIPDDIAHHTIDEATAAGLFHPRCKHVLSGFIPGFTVVPTPHVWNADDQTKYNQSQQQRALERAIRAAKRQLAGAFTPEMVSKAKLNLRRAQANMRSFIDETGRVRISRREQLTL